MASETGPTDFMIIFLICYSLVLNRMSGEVVKHANGFINLQVILPIVHDDVN